MITSTSCVFAGTKSIPPFKVIHSLTTTKVFNQWYDPTTLCRSCHSFLPSDSFFNLLPMIFKHHPRKVMNNVRTPPVISLIPNSISMFRAFIKRQSVQFTNYSLELYTHYSFSTSRWATSNWAWMFADEKKNNKSEQIFNRMGNRWMGNLHTADIFSEGNLLRLYEMHCGSIEVSRLPACTFYTPANIWAPIVCAPAVDSFRQDKENKNLGCARFYVQIRIEISTPFTHESYTMFRRWKRVLGNTKWEFPISLKLLLDIFRY